jgi:hypothetical protein
MKLQSLKQIRAPMTSQKQVQPASQKKCAQGYVRWLRLKVLEPASWSRIPSRHEHLRPTSQKEKKKKNFERPKTHKKEHGARPSTSDAPDNNTSNNLDAGESKRRRGRLRRRERAPECRPDGDEAALSLIRAG